MTPNQETAIDEAIGTAVYLGIDPNEATDEVRAIAAKLNAFSQIPKPAPVVSPLWADILNKSNRKQ